MPNPFILMEHQIPYLCHNSFNYFFFILMINFMNYPIFKLEPIDINHLIMQLKKYYFPHFNYNHFPNLSFIHHRLYILYNFCLIYISINSLLSYILTFFTFIYVKVHLHQAPAKLLL